MRHLRDLKISRGRVIPAHLLAVRFARSGGPGGQNVNKVSSKVDLRLNLEGLKIYLDEKLVGVLRSKLSARLDAGGNLQVVSSEHREQARNLEAALSRMESLLDAALSLPRKRRPTKQSSGSHQRRLAEKKARSKRKELRKATFPE